MALPSASVLGRPSKVPAQSFSAVSVSVAALAPFASSSTVTLSGRVASVSPAQTFVTSTLVTLLRSRVFTTVKMPG